MTDKAVSALTSLTGANTATGDLLYIVDISEAAAADRSKKITAEELQNYLKKFPATISVGGATPAASGAGISFPATASASSDANTLDDYEEGSWTPVVEGSTSAGTASYNVQVGSYTKIGNRVFFQFRVNYSGGTGTGNLRISGLPFASNANNSGSTVALYAENLTLSASNYPVALVGVSASTFTIDQLPVGGGVATSVAYDAAADISGSGMYFV